MVAAVFCTYCDTKEEIDTRQDLVEVATPDDLESQNEENTTKSPKIIEPQKPIVPETTLVKNPSITVRESDIDRVQHRVTLQLSAEKAASMLITNQSIAILVTVEPLSPSENCGPW